MFPFSKTTSAVSALECAEGRTSSTAIRTQALFFILLHLCVSGFVRTKRCSTFSQRVSRGQAASALTAADSRLSGDLHEIHKVFPSDVSLQVSRSNSQSDLPAR